MKSFDKVLSSLGFLLGSGMLTLSIILMLGCACCWARSILDGGWRYPSEVSVEYGVHCSFVSTLVCRYLGAQERVQPQLYADNLKCVSRDPGGFLRAARFTSRYVRLVGQERAPCKCVLMSTSRAVRSDMRSRIVTDEGHWWSVKQYVRDLGDHC